MRRSMDGLTLGLRPAGMIPPWLFRQFPPLALYGLYALVRQRPQEYVHLRQDFTQRVGKSG